MSKCTPKSDEFIDEIYEAIKEYNTKEKWSSQNISNIHVYYDASPYCTNRDYVASFKVDRTYYSGYSNDYVKYLMRKAGATNIIGGFRGRSNYVEFAFDIKQAKLKELEVEICKSLS